MVQYDLICKKAAAIKKKFATADVYELCNYLGITLLKENLGCSQDSIKGFFIEHCRIKTIVLNADLPEVLQRIILAHELGHALMHKAVGVHAFHEVSLFDETSTAEKEANLFAAELLLEDNEVLDALNRDMTFFSAASALMVPMELLDFKFRVLKWKGYCLMESPIQAKSTFLKDIPVTENVDDHIC